MDKPEALRMADHLESRGLLEEAAELRRLAAAEAQRDALLGALKEAADALEIASNSGGVNFYQYAREVRAAIKAVEEGK